MNRDPLDQTPVLLGFCSFKDGTFELIVQNEKTGEEIMLTGIVEPGSLERIDRVLPTCVYVEARPVNAKLITAAPAMLAALQAQEELAALRFQGEPAAAIAKVRDMRRAAIAKAKP